MFKAVIVAVALAVAVSAAGLEAHKERFGLWMQQHNKAYQSPEEHSRRFSIYLANEKRVEQLNAENSGAEYAINRFADLTAEEFAERYLSPLNVSRISKPSVADVAPLKDVPSDFSWVEKGAVLPIKNQESCGSCWAFSTVVSLEGAWFLAGNPLTSFSEQQLVDCDKECDPDAPQNCDSGCNGGLMNIAFQYVIKNGIETEQDYSYHATEGKCKYNKDKVKAHFRTWEMVPSDEEKMRDYLYKNGPISIAVDASGFQFYSRGIFDRSCSEQLNHGVALVGFGTDKTNGKDFWLLRNSWGTSWGMDGYMKIVRGKNKCGLADFACTIKV